MLKILFYCKNNQFIMKSMFDAAIELGHKPHLCFSELFDEVYHFKPNVIITDSKEDYVKRCAESNKAKYIYFNDDDYANSLFKKAEKRDVYKTEVLVLSESESENLSLLEGLNFKMRFFGFGRGYRYCGAIPEQNELKNMLRSATVVVIDSYTPRINSYLLAGASLLVNSNIAKDSHLKYYTKYSNFEELEHHISHYIEYPDELKSRRGLAVKHMEEKTFSKALEELL